MFRENAPEECEPAFACESIEEECDKERIERMPQETLCVVQRSIQSGDEEIDLVGDQRQRNVELGIVGREDTFDGLHRYFPHGGIVEDQEIIIETDELIAEGCAIDR